MPDHPFPEGEALEAALRKDRPRLRAALDGMTDGALEELADTCDYLADTIRARLRPVTVAREAMVPTCICDGGAYGIKDHPFLVNSACRVHGDVPVSVSE